MEQLERDIMEALAYPDPYADNELIRRSRGGGTQVAIAR